MLVFCFWWSRCNLCYLFSPVPFLLPASALRYVDPPSLARPAALEWFLHGSTVRIPSVSCFGGWVVEPRSGVCFLLFETPPPPCCRPSPIESKRVSRALVVPTYVWRGLRYCSGPWAARIRSTAYKLNRSRIVDTLYRFDTRSWCTIEL